MAVAGIEKVFIVIRDGKYDIPSYFTRLNLTEPSLAFITVPETKGVPFTLDRAHPFIQDSNIAFGFPDILFDNAGAFRELVDKWPDLPGDILLGVMPADNPRKVDMIEFGDNGIVSKLKIKPTESEHSHTWALALWTPKFTGYLHEKVKYIKTGDTGQKEIHLGDIINMAIEDGFIVKGHEVSSEPFIDIGTFPDLKRALAKYL